MKKVSNPVIVAGVAFLLVAAVFFVFHQFREKPPGSEAERIARLGGMDKENLLRKDASENEVFAALVRLAQQRIPEARTEAIRRSKNESRVVRGGAANALGYFDDSESLQILERLLEDQDVSVRVQAIYAVGRRNLPHKEKVLREVLEKDEITADEKIAVYSNLLLNGDKESKARAVQDLIGEAKRSPSLGLKLQAISTLSQAVPRDPRLIELYRFILSDAKMQALVPLAIKQLAAVKDPEAEKHLRRLLTNKDAAMRLAAVQSLHQICIPERWTVLTGIIKSEKDQAIRSAAIQESRSMPGADAISFLKTALESGMVHENETVTAKAILSELIQNPGVDPCAGAKK